MGAANLTKEAAKDNFCREDSRKNLWGILSEEKLKGKDRLLSWGEHVGGSQTFLRKMGVEGVSEAPLQI